MNNKEKKTFKPFIKQVKINSQKLMINSSQLVQINNEFWFVNKDSLFTIDIEGQIRNGFRLIDPVLNNLHNKDLVLGLSFNGEFIFAVNNDTNKTIFVIDPISKSIINKIYASGFNSGINSQSGNIRWITYDQTADSNRGGFWIGSWYNNFSQIDKQGQVLKTIRIEKGDDRYISSAYCDTLTPNGPFLWCGSYKTYSPIDGEINLISLKKDTSFGKLLPSYHNFAFDENSLSNDEIGFQFSSPSITNGFIDNQPVIWVYFYDFYEIRARCYPLSFLITDVSVEPFVTTSTYTKWPLYAIDTVWFKGKINNASPFTQYGAELTLNIVKDGAIEQSYSGTYNLQPFEIKEVIFGPYFPTQTGIYTLESHAMLEGDEDASNDDAISIFAITDSTYGRDTWNFLTNPAEFVDYKFMWGPDLGLSGDGGSDEQGALFTIDKPMLLTSVSAFLKPTEANDITTFDIHKINFSYIRAEPFAKTIPFSAKIEDTGIIKQYTIPLEGGGVRLAAGTYFINLKEGHSPNRMVYTRNNYVPYINKYYGDDLYYYNMEEDDNIRGALTIRPNFACKNELLAPSIIQSNQVLSCNSQYTDLKFQWYKNNVPVNNATNKNFYPRGEAGKYSVRINKENCYAMSEVFEIVTGVFNNTTQILNIYPNPTNGKAYINTDATMYGDMEIQVLDILGKTINTQIIKNTQPNQTISIDLKSTETGVYIIHAQIGEQMWEGKLVVE
ncbi:MAG: T9SS type A sorting domain-containing protein [Bacteroidetes bacterium]|nr:T9SS type A sorting domain-containing protein [Bacteroidota bacterium]